MRPINSMIEFKQIIGRGTRLFDGKAYFTIYDFADAYHHFSDPEWDGEPIDETSEKPSAVKEDTTPYGKHKGIVKITLGDGKMREIQHIIATSFWSADGKAISVQEFLQNLFGTLPEFFESEDELRRIWSYPMTRKVLLDKLADAGYDKADLITLQKLINAEKSDLFDVLEYVSFAVKPMTRKMRAADARSKISAMLNRRQKEFLEFVLSRYIESGVEELDQEKLPDLLMLKYQSVSDAADMLGGADNIRTLFTDFQKYLYERAAA